MFYNGTEAAEIAGLFYSDIPMVLALPVGVAIITILLIGYYFNPQGWKRLYAYSVLFMAVFTGWLLMTSNVLGLLLGRQWYIFSYYALRVLAYLLPVAANLVIYELLKDKNYARMGLVIGAFALLGISAAAGQLLGYESLEGCMDYYYPLLGIGELPAIYWCIRAARQGDALCQAIIPAAVILRCWACLTAFPISLPCRAGAYF